MNSELKPSEAARGSLAETPGLSGKLGLRLTVAWPFATGAR